MDILGLVAYSSSSESDDDDDTVKQALCKDDESSLIDSTTKTGAVLSRKRPLASKSSTEKLAKRLPLPSSIKSMYQTKDTDLIHTDHPETHQGRVRSFEHERGNWASYVYVPVLETMEQDMRLLACKLCEKLCIVDNFKPIDDLHISLSKTFVIRHHWIQPLFNTLKEKTTNSFRCELDFQDIELYANEEKTRTFVGLQVAGQSQELLSFVKSIDFALEEFKLPKYYEKPSFHVSLAWALGDITGLVDTSLTQELQDIVNSFLSDTSRLFVLPVEELRLKTGNLQYAIPLRDSG